MARKHTATNLLLLMDTHSDYATGELVNSDSADGKLSWTQNAATVSPGSCSDTVFDPPPQVLRHYMGPELWNETMVMEGTKGAIILACGPAFTNLDHYEIIKELVSR